MARGGRRTSTNLIADPNQIRAKFLRAKRFELDELDIVGASLKNKTPIHFGGMSDPFSNKAVSSVSKEVLEILADFQYPVVLSTKNTTELMNYDTVKLLSNLQNLIIQVSITSINEISKILEPNVPDTIHRVNTLKALSLEGFYTIARLQPLLPIAIPETTSELIPLLAQAGVKHVVVEFLKIPLEQKLTNFSDLFNSIRWDGSKYYREVKAIRTGREWVLPVEYKWELLQPIIEAIHKNGMTYGAGDYGLNHLSDTDCCCGIDRAPGFTNYFKGNIPYVIKKSQTDQLTIHELEKYCDSNKSIRMYMNSQCRTDNATSLLDFMRSKWNRPNTENAPNTFLGVSWCNEYDNEGNCIYTRRQL